MFSPESRLEAQIRGRLGEGRDGDGIAEHVVYPAQIGGLRRNRDARIEKTQIVAVARSAHEPVLAQGHRLLIAVFSAMRDAKYGQLITVAMLTRMR
jgi:hypothetical protein